MLVESAVVIQESVKDVNPNLSCLQIKQSKIVKASHIT